MKRTSGQHRPDKQKKQARDVTTGPVIREGVSFTQLELAPTQSVVFTGSALLEVTAGCLSVYGALVTPDSGPVRLHAPTKFGRALQLTALAGGDAAPPCHPSTEPVQAVLQPLQGVQQQQQQQQEYSVVDAAAEDAPTAWQVPPAWAQATGDLSALAAAGAADGSVLPAAGRVPLSVAVCGSKGCGKSAFARLLVNSLLGQGHGVVAYLDLDPGQPEFTPPGLLSLQLLRQPVFGPSHLQHQQPLLAYFQGDTSSQSEPGRYLQAVQALVQRYNSLSTADVAPAAAAAGGGSGGEQLQVLPPLVINTPGWITGLGLDLLSEVLRCAAPTHVVQLQTGNAKKNLPAAAWWLDSSMSAAAAGAGAGSPAAVLPVLLQVPSASGAAGGGEPGGPAGSAAAAAAGGGGAGQADSLLSSPSGDTTQTVGGKGAAATKGVSAAAARNLMWLAWAERVAAANSPPAAPVAAAGGGSMAAAAGGGGSVAAAAAGAEDFAGVAAALAAAVPVVVSLRDAEVEVLHVQVAPAELPVALNGAVVGLSASSSSSSGSGSGSGGVAAGLRECFGLGFVRAVDGPQQELFVLTDLPEQQLQRVDLLQLGKLELPDKLLECRAFASPYQGLFCLTSTATGAGQIKSRNNLLRSSQLLR